MWKKKSWLINLEFKNKRKKNLINWINGRRYL